MNNKIFRVFVRKILKESFHQDYLNSILDKISQYGIENISPYERQSLDNIHKNKVINSKSELIFDFLDFNLSNLKEDSYYSDKMAKKVSGIRYYTNELQFDLEVESEVLGIRKKINTLYVNVELDKLLTKEFNLNEIESKTIIKLWFENHTKIKVSSISYLF